MFATGTIPTTPGIRPWLDQENPPRMADVPVEAAHDRVGTLELRAIDLECADREPDDPSAEQDEADGLVGVDEGPGSRDHMGQEESDGPTGPWRVLQPIEAGAIYGVEIRGKGRGHVEELEGDQQIESGRCPQGHHAFVRVR